MSEEIIKYTVTKLISTCDASPSQWEGMTDNGLEVYIKYRWGNLRAWVAKGKNTEALDGPCIFDKQITTDALDGCMDIEVMKHELRKIFRFSLNTAATQV